MLLLLRKALFYLLLVLYLIITPYIIFHGLGYGVDPTEGSIYKTGLVSVITEPKGATVFLENRKYSSRTPTALGGLLPGQYHVRLVKKGYEPWQKTIDIVAEKATRLEPVVLLASKKEEERLVSGTFKDILPKGSDFKIFSFREKTLSDLLKIDLFFRQQAPLVPARGNAEPVKILEDIVTQDSSAVLFRVKKSGKEGWFFLDLERERIIAELTTLIPEKPDLIEWDPKNPDYLYLLKKGQLTVIDVAKHLAYPIGDNDTIGLGAKQRRLYFLKKDFTLWHANARGENSLPVAEKEGLKEKAFASAKAETFKIDLLKRELFQGELFLFLGDNGALTSNWLPYQLVEKRVRGYLHGVRGETEKILYWTDHEMGLFDFAMKGEEEEAFPPRVLLYRTGKNIKQAFWSFDQTHIVFLDEDEIFFLEAGEIAPYLIRSLGRTARGSRIFYHDRQHALYYIDAATHKLMRRKISE